MASALVCVPLVFLLTLVGSLVAGCGSPASSTSATPPPATVTPTPTLAPGSFYFRAEDGVTLNGQLYGNGSTAVIFSAMDEDSHTEWQSTAEALATRGYLAMTYDYRGVGPSGGLYQRDQLDRDLRGAIAVVRSHGATKVVLMGASMGGLVTLKVAVSEHPTAVVAVSPPQSFGGMSVSNAEMAGLTAPKLFLVGRDDHPFYNSVQALYDASPQPKQLYVYANNYHGVDFFNAPDTSPDALARLVAFLSSYAPA